MIIVTKVTQCCVGLGNLQLDGSSWNLDRGHGEFWLNVRIDARASLTRVVEMEVDMNVGSMASIFLQ